MITQNEIEAVFNRIRPALQANGADIKLLEIEGKNVRVILYMGCDNSLSSSRLLGLGVERTLREEIAGFGELIAENAGNETTPLFEG